MEIEKLALSPAQLFLPRTFVDGRGFFRETYKPAYDLPCEFVQDNHSFSRRGTLRGMHFQTFPGQAKLIYVAIGTIFDVIVDVRKESPTFGKWEGVYLDGETGSQLFIPLGFAHGFYVVSEYAHVLYKVSSPYNPLTEKTFSYNDPDVAIQWPCTEPLLSERDRFAPKFSEVCT